MDGTAGSCTCVCVCVCMRVCWGGMESSEELYQIVRGASTGSGTEVLLLKCRGWAVLVLPASGALF